MSLSHPRIKRAILPHISPAHVSESNSHSAGNSERKKNAPLNREKAVNGSSAKKAGTRQGDDVLSPRRHVSPVCEENNNSAEIASMREKEIVPRKGQSTHHAHPSKAMPKLPDRKQAAIPPKEWDPSHSPYNVPVVGKSMPHTHVGSVDYKKYWEVVNGNWVSKLKPSQPGMYRAVRKLQGPLSSITSLPERSVIANRKHDNSFSDNKSMEALSHAKTLVRQRKKAAAVHEAHHEMTKVLGSAVHPHPDTHMHELASKIQSVSKLQARWRSIRLPLDDLAPTVQNQGVFEDNNVPNAKLYAAIVSHNISEAMRALKAGSSQDVLEGCWGKCPLIVAAQEGMTELIQSMLSHNHANINAIDHRGYTALHWAAYRGQAATVTALMDHLTRKQQQIKLLGGPPRMFFNVTSKSGNTALHTAVMGGHEQVVTLLLAYPAWSQYLVNNLNVAQLSALHIAVLMKNMSMVQALTRVKGVRVDIRGSRGRTPLYEAVQLDELPIVTHLIQRGADPKKCDSSGKSVFHAACGAGASVGTLDLLLALEGVYLNLTDKAGWQPIHVAASNGYSSTVDYLLQRGADLEAVNRAGLTSLHVAASYGKVNVLQLLMDRGHRINCVQRSGLTPLHLACSNMHSLCVELLIREGALLTLVNSQGRLPLHSAVLSQKLEIVKLLCESAAFDPQQFVQRDNFQWTPFALACGRGASEIVTYILTFSGVIDPLIHACNRLGSSPLHIAASMGQAANVQALVQARAPLEMIDLQGFIPLFSAIYHGNLETVQLLIDAGSDVHHVSEHAMTAMHVCASRGHFHLVDYLASHGVEINRENSDGITPLMQSVLLDATEGHVTMIHALHQAGAAVDQQNARKQSAMQKACSLGKLTAMHCLLECGASLQLIGPHGWTLLHASVHHNHPAMFSLLKDNHFEISSIDDQGSTALHLACSDGLLSWVKQLIEAKIDLHHFNAQGLQAWHLAILGDQLEIVQYLVQMGADVQSKASGGMTALHMAASMQKQTDLSRYLLTLPLDINATTESGMTPLSAAIITGNVPFCQMLLEKEALTTGVIDDKGRTLLHLAVSKQLHWLVEALLKRGDIDVNAISSRGWTALHEAAKVDDDGSLSKLLLSAGADPDAQSVDPTSSSKGWTPTITAVQKDKANALRVIVAAGANTSLTDHEGWSPLHFACAHKKGELVKILLKAKASTSQSTSSGWLPMHICAFFGFLEGGKLLWKSGASTTALDAEEKSPADYATANKRTKFAQFLRYSKDPRTVSLALALRE
jgi:ankyrin repeat protein